jgi:S-DNA-T family DNA segregation ATPase FtsK/SpoIIIE
MPERASLQRSTQQLLCLQADRIELVLASHKVPARVTGGKVTPRLVRYHLTTPLGVKVKQVAGLAEELALSLGASSCRVYREEGQVQVEVPRSDGQVVYLLDVCRRLEAANEASASRAGRRTRSSPGPAAVPPVTAVLGLDAEGTPLLLRLPSPNVAHVLIAGTTGSGKTALARTIVASLAALNSQRQLQVALVDPKGRGLAAFAGLPHLLRPVVAQVEEAEAMLGWLVAEMERRDREKRAEPRVVVVLDELADLVQMGGRGIEEPVRRLTQRGREAGLHMVACTQKPAASVIGSLVKSNFPVRLVGSVASPEDAKVATGLAGTGAERLLGEGDFLVVAKGQVTRMQAAYISAAEVRDLVDRVGTGSTPPVRAAGSHQGQTFLAKGVPGGTFMCHNGSGPPAGNPLRTGTDGRMHRENGARSILRRVK